MQDPDRQALRQSAWRQMALARGTAARLLRPIASAYGWMVELRHRLYNRGWLASTRLPVPVVVVGNVVVGGAGKTPAAIAVVRHLLPRGGTRAWCRAATGERIRASGRSTASPPPDWWATSHS